MRPAYEQTPTRIACCVTMMSPSIVKRSDRTPYHHHKPNKGAQITSIHLHTEYYLVCGAPADTTQLTKAARTLNPHRTITRTNQP